MAAMDAEAAGAPKKKVNPLLKVYNAMPTIASGGEHRDGACPLRAGSLE